MKNINLVGKGDFKRTKSSYGSTNEQSDELISSLIDWIVEDDNIQILVAHRTLGDPNTADVLFVHANKDGSWNCQQWQFASAKAGLICHQVYDLEGSETTGVVKEVELKCPWRPVPDALASIIGNIGVPWVDREDVLWIERDLALFVKLFGKEGK